MVMEEEVVMMVMLREEEQVVVSWGVDDAEVVVQRDAQVTFLRDCKCTCVCVCVCVCAATMRVLAYVQANPGPAIEEIKDLVRGWQDELEDEDAWEGQ